eukprot:Hpha_TRINITY_DN9601_c0_g2::TRINITY_DN9601_c0_g2_i1::g.184583::m.184583/K15083/RAD16; DNA repair protein RAD16
MTTRGLLGRGPLERRMTITDEEDWETASDGDEVYTHRAGYAPSGRAKCKLCSEPIALGEVRLGTPLRWRPGSYNTIWAHPACTRLPGKTQAQLKREIFGFRQLKGPHQQSVLSELTSKKTPRCMEQAAEFDHDTFWARTVEELPRVATPEAMTCKLLPFQERGVGWMLNQEASEFKGGILADEMGLGKTIQTIGLLVSSLVGKSNRARRTAGGATLIVAPASAMLQWRDELERFVDTGKVPLKVHIFHGASRDKASLARMTVCDVVLTTYNTLELSYRTVLDAAKVPCQYCGKRYLPRTLISHLRFFCGPDAERSDKLALRDRKRKATALMAAEKAKATLRIGEEEQETGVPSLMNIYRDIMHSAGRRPLGLYEHAAPKEEREQMLSLTLQIVGRKPLELSAPSDATLAWLKRQAGRATGQPAANVRLIRAGKFITDHDATALTAVGVNAGETLHAAIGAQAAASVPGTPAAKRPRLDEDAESTPVAQRSTPSRRKASSGGKRTGRSVSVVDDDSSDDDSSDADVSFGRGKKPAPKRGKGAKPAPKRGTQTKGRRKLIVSSEEETSSSEEEDSSDEPPPRKRKASAPQPKRGGKKQSPSALAAMAKATKLDLSLSPLHAVQWGRIVLDEAHKIKGRVTGVAKASYALNAKQKWCLTGTPLQNRVGELFSLVRFLQFEPFAFYGCTFKGCDCKSLDWSFGPMQRECVCCGHPAPFHFSHFNRRIVNPITRYGNIGDGRQAMLRLKNDILDKIQLRRTKAMCAAEVGLPPLTIRIDLPEFDAREKDFYEALYKRSAAKFDGYVKKGTLLHNYAHIFELLARLRQACDHPYIVTRAQDSGQAEPADGCCGLCGEDLGSSSNTVRVPCKHRFHQDCAEQYAATAPDPKKLRCPAFCCGKAFKADILLGQGEGKKRGGQNEEEDDDDEEPEEEVTPKRQKRPSLLDKVDKANFLSSAKIEALLADLAKQAEGTKSLVFSQFGGMLEIVEWRLRRGGMKVVKLVGSMAVEERAKVLTAFREDPSVSALLLSLRAGGEGLNLQVATRVYTLEPWWNPAVEMQAIQRAHRIGQKNPVVATRYIVKGTIEERMLQLQEKKQLVFDGTIDCDGQALAKLSKEDLAFLFKR